MKNVSLMMVGTLRLLTRALTALSLVLVLTACGGGLAGGFNSYQSPDGRYAFLYPTGWTRVTVSGGPKVVFHDLINSDETLSLVVSEVGEDIELKELGSAEAVGARLMQEVIAPEGAGREVDLVDAKERKDSDHTFYDLEYTVSLQDRDRHEVATVVVDRGYLYTLAASTNESRWLKVQKIFERAITSFTFLI